MIERLEFHYTPKQELANMAEIEFSGLQQPMRRIEDEVLTLRVPALETERHQAGATIEWRFTDHRRPAQAASVSIVGFTIDTERLTRY